MKLEFEWINDTLRLKYPCPWTYKLIGESAKKIRRAAAEVVAPENYTVRFSNLSSKGTYICLDLEMVVESEEQRTDIFRSLKRHRDIKMVL